MPKKITFITCTVCTLGLSGSVGGLIHSLNDLDEDSLLIKEMTNLKDKKQKLEKKLKNNKSSDNKEENEKISKEIKFLEEKLKTKTSSLIDEIKELAGKILNVFLKAIQESKESEKFKEYQDLKNVQDLIDKINKMEVYYVLGESVRPGSDIEKEKKYYDKKIKSKIFEDIEAKKIYEQIVKKAFA